MDNFIGAILGGLMILGLIFVIALIMMFPLMWAWNCVMPHLFGFPTIGLIHSLSLLIVSGSLIKSSHSSKGK